MGISSIPGGFIGVDVFFVQRFRDGRVADGIGKGHGDDTAFTFDRTGRGSDIGLRWGGGFADFGAAFVAKLRLGT